MRPERRRSDLIVVDPVTGCHIWTGFLTDEGYAYGTYWDPIAGRRKYTTRHRIVYLEAFGYDSIPEGWEVDHRCRRRACLNVAHLEAVSVAEHGKRSSKALQTHCIHGHEFTPENTIQRPNGNRGCRECGRQSSRKYAQRKKAQLAT